MASTWEVTGQEANQTQFNAGNPVTGHVITFVTGNGWRDTVFVPDAQYANIAAVKRAIQAAANLADSVGALKND